MGNCCSTPTELTPAQIQQYVADTFLLDTDVIDAHRRFLEITNGAEMVTFPQFSQLPQLKHNPYTNRIFELFANPEKTGIPVDNWMQVCSVLSERASVTVKKYMVFRIFDTDNDGVIAQEDLFAAIDMMRKPPMEWFQVEESAAVLELTEQQRDEKTETNEEEKTKNTDGDDPGKVHPEPDITNDEQRTAFLLLQVEASYGLKYISEQIFGKILDQIPDFDIKFTTNLYSKSS
eukprot:PhF_6_TR34737/c0_g1_i1/m.50556/K17259/CIB1; calcium and integrin-binding protein 1